MVKISANVGKKITKGFTRPEGAGNFDNMDDYNIVDSIDVNHGRIQDTPTVAKDIVNKEYVDDNTFWTRVGTTISPKTPGNDLDLGDNKLKFTGSEIYRDGPALHIDSPAILSIDFGGTPKYAWQPTIISPTNAMDGLIDLGDSTHQFKDLYLAGNIDLGTNTITDGAMTGNWDFGSGNLTTNGNMFASDTMQCTEFRVNLETSIPGFDVMILGKSPEASTGGGIFIEGGDGAASTTALPTLGYNGGEYALRSGPGGAASGLALKGGNAGDCNIIGGDGGKATASGSANYKSGDGAEMVLRAGNGEIIAGSTGGSATGGDGGNWLMTSGTGGTTAFNGATNNAGDAGDFTLAAGSGGTSVGTGSAGDGGSFQIAAGEAGVDAVGATPGVDGDIIFSKGLFTNLAKFDNTANIFDILIDMDFTGASAGLPFGGISVVGGSTNTTLNSTGGKVQITTFTTDDTSNGTVVPDSANDEVGVAAGKYMVTISITAENKAGASHVLNVGLWNAGGSAAYTNVHAHRTLGAGTDIGSISLSGLIDVTSATDLELWADTDRAVNTAVLFSDIIISVVKVGGT